MTASAPGPVALLARGSLLRGLSLGVGLVLGVPASALLVRALGVGGYGALAFAMGIVSFIAILADLGMGFGVTRLVSADDDPAWGRVGARVALVTGLAGTAACLAAAAALDGPGRAVLALAAPIALLLTLRQSLAALLMARNRALLVEGSWALQQTVYYGVAMVLAGTGIATGWRVAALAVVTQALGLALIVPAWRRLADGPASARPRPADAGPSVRRLLAASLPLALGGVAWVAMQRSDVILLGALRGAEAVGRYAPVLRVVDLTAVGLGVLGAYLLPVGARLAARGETAALRTVYATLAKWGLVLAGPVLAMLVAAPAPLLVFLYGPSYAGTGDIARILAAGYAVNVLAGHNARALMALGRNRAIAIRSAVALVVNLVLNALLIPRLGATGAAIGTAVAYAGLNAANSVLVYRAARLHPVRRDVVAVAAAVALGGVAGFGLAWALGLTGSVVGTLLVGAVSGLAGLAVAVRTATPEERALIPRRGRRREAAAPDPLPADAS